ncbi:hypothetical protein QJS10_CPA09g00170 [Acorus calamus]|uniref:Translation factor GUF1 homolog, mitochondrial n=1 Tax=Acorus calamus TaxID=4465 RepID=A0AAV9E2J8_ACOCL|nr:hypothetical protein QJS10_CPA09g00170 [Acorus calamus]
MEVATDALRLVHALPRNSSLTVPSRSPVHPNRLFPTRTCRGPSTNAFLSSRRRRHGVFCRASAAGTQSKGVSESESAGQDRLMKVPISNIRNFCIIAHIDHGKSTLADKLLQMTGTVQKREMKEQFLDNMDLERERGITIKLQAARMRFVLENEPYCLNLIDTPGHVDFSYEVSRSLAACEGALLVVDASQGVEAQTLANVYLALESNLEIIPVLNKIDLPGAEPDRVSKEIEEEGVGITEILSAIVKKIPPPQYTAEMPLRALIFDSYYDPYRGVIVYFRVVDGTIKKGDRIYFMASGKDYFADEIGVMSPNQMQVDELYAGEVGYLAASIRSVADARVGDTITHFGRKANESLPGYEEATPMVFCGLFPVDADQFPDLRDALEKLQLNDAALKFEPESSSAMGFGFRCGFLGLLHMEIVQERLEREYNLSLITTAPSVVYRVNCVNGDTLECSNPSLLPEPGKRRFIEEPYVKIEMLTPKEYIGPLMELGQDRRGEFKEMNYITENRASLIYLLPLAEVNDTVISLQMVGDFFDQLKSRSKGYASMEYSLVGYRESELVRLDIQINGELVEPLATIVHKDKAEGKKRMKAIGKVDVPQEAFMAVLRLEKEGPATARLIKGERPHDTISLNGNYESIFYGESSNREYKYNGKPPLFKNQKQTETIKKPKQWKGVMVPRRALAEYVAGLSEASVKERGSFSIVLSSGISSTLFGALTKGAYVRTLDWSKWYIFWAEEVVFKDKHNPNTYYKQAKQSFLSKVPVSPGHVTGMSQGCTGEEAAEEYEFWVRQLVRDRTVPASAVSDCPRFDLLLLSHHHVASLHDRRHPAVLAKETQWWVAAAENDDNDGGCCHVSVTLPVINAAAHVAVVAEGFESRFKSGLGDGFVSPSHGEVVWFADFRAAGVVGFDG